MTFLPDADRSGRFVCKRSSMESGCEREEPVSTSDESSSEDEHEQVVEDEPGDSDDGMLPVPDDGLVLNNSARVLHMDGVGALACGLGFATHVQFLKGWLEGEARFCARCWRS